MSWFFVISTSEEIPPFDRIVGLQYTHPATPLPPPLRLHFSFGVWIWEIKGIKYTPRHRRQIDATTENGYFSSLPFIPRNHYDTGCQLYPFVASSLLQPSNRDNKCDSLSLLLLLWSCINFRAALFLHLSSPQYTTQIVDSNDAHNWNERKWDWTLSAPLSSVLPQPHPDDTTWWNHKIVTPWVGNLRDKTRQSNCSVTEEWWLDRRRPILSTNATRTVTLSKAMRSW